MTCIDFSVASENLQHYPIDFVDENWLLHIVFVEAFYLSI